MTHIDTRFWDGERWDSHAAFNTITHTHVSCYHAAPGHEDCDITVVGCADGRWFVEDNWGGDAKGAEKVWNPFDPSGAMPHFFATEDEAMAHAAAVVSAISGVPVAKFMPD